MDQEVGICSCFHFAGPDDDARHARAAFIDRGLAAAARQVAGGGDVGVTLGVGLLGRVRVAAVVGPENDDGIVSFAGFFEVAQKSAHGVVHAFHHRGVERIPLWIGGVGPLLEVFDVVPSCIPR